MTSATPMDPLKPYSFNHANAAINGLEYHYIDQRPSKASSKPPVVLVHGFPDLWYGWRYQIPALVKAGHRVIVPSPPGYCGSESPRPYEYYTFKRVATDFIALLSKLDIQSAIFIGHDWGSPIVQRIALWFPQHVLAVGAICVAFVRVHKTFVPLEKMVEKWPNFAYQLWFASPDAERTLSTPDAIEKFLKAVFRIKGDAPVVWNVSENTMEKIGNPSLGKVWENQEVWNYYLQSFQREESLRGPLSYYKTRELNYRDELALVGKGRGIECPALFIGAKDDRALPPSTWRGQNWVKNLEMHSVAGGHWCLVENEGKEITPIILKWVEKVSKSSKL